MTIKKVTSPHDKFFKSAMANIRVAKEFFEEHLPHYLRDKVDLDTLRPSPNSYIQESLQATLSDVLYQVQIAGEEAYLYILCEHQSSADPLMPFRIWQYTVGIWSDHLKQTKSKRLPLVVPIVFYNGRKPYSGSRHIRDLINAPSELITQVLQDPFHLVDTHTLEDTRLQEQLWAGLMAFVMKHIYTRDIINYIKQIAPELQKLEVIGGGSDYIVLLLNYVLTQGETAQAKALLEFVEHELSPQVGEKIMTIAEQFIEQGKKYGIQEGINRGIDQGITQGIRQGQHTIFIRQLERKFSLIPQAYQELIKQADEETLLSWSECILYAKTLEEVFEE
ncbi:MAG: Rpn family recombination-promoting nuclease/putative transposase [Proteobacteria bacterium]|nr:Rpn family recombination-promoting nuclease/putative transposase [Pseudomonadota bacterium]